MTNDKNFYLFLAIGCAICFFYMTFAAIRGTSQGWERKNGQPNITRYNRPYVFYALTAWIWFGAISIGGIGILAIHDFLSPN
jgi:hypothetical protein